MIKKRYDLNNSTDEQTIIVIYYVVDLNYMRNHSPIMSILMKHNLSIYCLSYAGIKQCRLINY